MTEYLYRYEGVTYAAPLDEYDMPMGSGRRTIRLDKYEIIKRTPKGAWVWAGLNYRKFVLTTPGGKRFAYETEVDALRSLIARKKRQKSIYQARINAADGYIALANRELAKHLPESPGCHAGRDGDCFWEKCPQIRDGEPAKTGRHCPRDRMGDDDER